MHLCILADVKRRGLAWALEEFVVFLRSRCMMPNQVLKEAQRG
jgi:hypothetical protein